MSFGRDAGTSQALRRPDGAGGGGAFGAADPSAGAVEALALATAGHDQNTSCRPGCSVERSAFGTLPAVSGIDDPLGRHPLGRIAQRQPPAGAALGHDPLVRRRPRSGSKIRSAGTCSSVELRASRPSARHWAATPSGSGGSEPAYGPDLAHAARMPWPTDFATRNRSRNTRGDEVRTLIKEVRQPCRSSVRRPPDCPVTADCPVTVRGKPPGCVVKNSQNKSIGASTDPANRGLPASPYCSRNDRAPW
ncbi:hypothetical protein SAMN05444276_102475 [Paracoccus sanguinis]|uniref:Uncharacterized protein n=1 Tax=Paracoccus sanguinis TaxID=1545044 RepID=A0A1H2XE86_9RHOB|nr:hypothetical protein SAMN05444276_102475 [Paracoccus sanguinis]